MSNTIKLKRGSGSDPNSSDLIVGELAIRTDTAKLFTKKDNGSVVEILGSAGGGLTNGDKGDITVSNDGDTLTVDNGVINNAKVASDAAIAGTKISPDFGSQNIVTTGVSNLSGELRANGNIRMTNASPKITFVDAEDNPDFEIGNLNGIFRIRDATNSSNRLTINTSGVVDVAQRLDANGGLAVTGDITGTGDLTLTSTDAGSEASPIIEFYRNSASPADADYLGQIKFTGEDDAGGKRVVSKITGKIDDASAGTVDGIIEFMTRKAGSANISARLTSTDLQLINGTGLEVAGNITVTGTVDGRDVATDGTKLDGIETGATADQTKSDIDALGIAASTAATLATARTIAGTSFDGSANIDISYTNLTNKLSVGDGGLTQNNFTNALKTKLDGVETGATADQTAAEIKTLLDSNGIVNSNVNASAAIDGTKISPNFGSQNVVTTGTLGSGDITITDASPSLNFSETGADPDYKIVVNSGKFRVYDTTNGADRFVVNTDGHIDIAGNTDFGAGIDVTGNITTTGDITLADDKKLILGAGSDLSIYHDSTHSHITNATNDLTISCSTSDADLIVKAKKVSLKDLNNNFLLRGETDAEVKVYHNGSIKLQTTSSGVSVTGAIAVSGTVDGVDIATRNTLFGGLTSSSGVLTNGVTATTQSASDNSTKVATTAYTDTAIANLIDSSPGTLNTLNELAAALGDDASFSTTVTNSIATKLPLAGGTLTGNLILGDSVEAIFGANSDLKLFHNGSRSEIVNSNVNNFTIRQAYGGNGFMFVHADKLQLRSHSTNEEYVSCYNNGQVEIFHNNSKKFNTTATGVNITGSISVSGTVDGRDLATDGTKLDGIESNATADQTAAEIRTLVESASDSNVFTDADHSKLNGIEASATADQTASEILTLIKTVDGAGSGLDADTLDGISSASFLRSDANDTSSGTVAFGVGTLDPDSFTSHSGGFGGISDGGWGARGVFVHGGGTGDAAAMAHNGSALYFGIQNGSSTNSMATWLQVTPGTRVINFQTADNANNVQIGGNKVFHAGNDGSGSGLDSDLLDGVQGSSYLRSDAADTCSGKITFSDGIVLPTTGDGIKFGAGDAANDDAHIEWLGSSNGGYLRISTSDDSDSGNPEYIEFGDYATQNKVGDFTQHLRISRERFLVRTGSNSITQADRLNIDSSGTVDIYGNLDVGAGLDVTGNISVTGTVDGRDLATDGSKLDGIAAGATNVTNTNQLTNGAGFITATLTNEQVQDIVGGMVVSNTESGITVQYSDSAGKLNFTVASQTDNNFTNADHSKLDGIEANATADQTASEILTLIKTVDGAGSGLDSDLLDGQSSAFYRSAGNINAGTLAAARLGVASTSESGISAVGNFGQYEAHGTYNNFNTEPAYWGWNFVQGNTNAPNTTSSQWYRCRLSLGSDYGKGSGSGDYSLEMALPRSSHSAAGVLHIRAIEGGNEGSWTTVGDNASLITTGTLPAARIGSNAVTFARMQDIAEERLIGRVSSGSGDPEALTQAQVRTFLGLASSATTDTTNASNISSGTVNTARLPITYTKADRVTIQSTGGGNDVLLDAADHIILEAGEEEDGSIIFRGNSGTDSYRFSKSGQTAIEGMLSFESLSADRIFTFPNTAGTIALTSDIPTNNNQLTNGAGYITSADGGNAATLDNLDSTQFLRSDANDSILGTLTVGDGTGQHELHLKKADNNTSDHLIFFNGTTRVGEIGCHDTTWLRINQETAKNIYTPRYIRADAGFFVDGTSKGINGSGNFIGGTIAGASDYGTLVRSNANDTVSGNLNFTSTTTPITTNSVKFNNSEMSTSYYTDATGVLAFDENFYSDTAYGTGATSPMSTFTSNGGGLLIKNEDGWGAILSSTNIQYCEGNFANLKINSNQVFHAGNDGAGSGLDADTLDGVQGSSYLRSDTADTITATLTARTIVPQSGNTYNLGSTSARWNNLYVNDMHFSNEGKTNDVDGTWGDWTLQEGESDIFMINNRSGKKFKIAMIPV